MPRLNMYEQQTIAQSPTASGSAFGAQVGEATAQMGNVIQDIGVQMKRREDVIDRTIRARDFDTWAQESLRGLEPADLARAETFEQYRQGLDQKFQEVLGSHNGTSASKAEFKNQLLNQRHQYEKSAREAQVKAQHTVLGNIITDTVNQLGAQAAFVPDMMDSIFAELDYKIDEFRDALPAESLEQYKRAGRSEIAVTSIQALLSEGNADAAESLLKNPEVSKYLNPNLSRKFTIDVKTEQVKKATQRSRQESNLATWANVLGIPVEQLSPQQRMMIENADPKLMEQAQRFTLVEMLTGKRPDGEMTERLFGLDRAERTNRTRDIAAMAPAYAAGQLSAEDAAVFEMEVAKTFRPTHRQDPVTGQFFPIPGSENIPPSLARQLTQGRNYYGGVAPAPQRPLGGEPVGAQMTQETMRPLGQGETPQPGQTVQLDVGGRTIGRGQVDQSGRWSITDNSPRDPAVEVLGDTPMLEQGGGIWGVADKVAGLPAAGLRLLGGGPIPLGIGQAQVAAAQEVELQQRNLVRALQQNPRYAEGERQDIARSISIEPAALSNPQAYRTRLLEIGRYVQEELRHQQSVISADPSTTTVEMRQQALRAIPLFQKFYQRLGLPPTVKTPEEALKMNPRPRQVIGPDGFTIYDVPQE